ncbi:MAG: ChbG/HpnK family deacetylase [bacterium]|nr:ChbG/HpnK family deacetylase [bacterium]
MKRAIVNADDFGIAPGVSRGILRAFREGVLTSTTMLCNLGGFDDGVALARENPDLPLGIHLSLLWGPPVSDPATVPTLMQGDGCFPRSLTLLARRYYLGRLSAAQVRLELGAQIRRFLDAGLTPTHVDTHKHIHCLPGILDAVLDVAAEHGIRCVRFPGEAPVRAGSGCPRPGIKARAKRDLIRFLSRGGRRKLEAAGFRTTDHFVGIAYMDLFDAETLSFLLRNLAGGVTEIMCHPGHADPQADIYSSNPPGRERELAALIDPRVREAAAASSVELTDYRTL